MKTVLALCSAADVTGSVRQFDLALPWLRERFEVVRHTTPADVPGLIAALQPALVHTLGADAFRVVQRVSVAAVARRQVFPKWLAAGAAGVEPLLGFAAGLTATFSQTEHERDWAARLMPAPQQFSAKVAVAPPTHFASRGRSEQHILAAGGFDAVANLKHVVWAFDAFRYAHPASQLVLLGLGPQRPDVKRFAQSLGLGNDLVRLAGFQPDVAPDLLQASQVWCAHTRGGTKFLLEAMAAGVPVLAYRTPDTERLLKGGECGRLVAGGLPVELARAAHVLLSEPDEAQVLVVAGQAAAARYPVANLADALAGVYDTLTSSASPRCE